MKDRRFVVGLVSLLALAASAHAQLTQAYLSVDGNDNWPCTLAKPCRTIPAALGAVAAGGQVWILDSGTFNAGTVLVDKSVSIQAVAGQSAVIAASGATQAMIVKAPGVTVGLRNLTFVGTAQTQRAEGLKILDAAVVSVESCVFADLNLDSLVAINTPAVVHVADTTFRNIDGWSVAAWNGPTINVANSRMHHTEGPFVFTTRAGVKSTMIISDTTISDGNEGVFVSTNTSGAVAQAFLTRTAISNTRYGLDAEAAPGSTALITVSHSMVTNSTNAFVIGGAGAAVKSLGNNHIADNAGEIGVLTPAAQR